MVFENDYGDCIFSHKIDARGEMRRDFKRHFHTFYEILLFKDGRVDYVVENKMFSLSHNDLMLIKPGEHHYVNSIENRRYDRYVLKFPESAVPKHLADKLKEKKVKRNVAGERIAELFGKLDAVNAENLDAADRETLERCTLAEILVYLCNTENTDETVYSVNDRLNEILEYINSNLDKPLTLGELCAKFYLSRSYLSRLFSDCLQTSAAQYIRTKKIFLADKYLKNGVKPTEVYLKCGFDNYSTFYRAYLSVMNRSPSDEMKVTPAEK